MEKVVELFKKISDTDRKFIKSKTLEVTNSDVTIITDNQTYVSLYLDLFSCFVDFYRVDARDCYCIIRSNFPNNKFHEQKTIVRKSWTGVFNALGNLF